MERATILLVEDETIVALDLASQLLDLGHTVVGQATRGETAVSKALELKPDLILMDIQLRGEMDGIQAAQRIHETADIPVIYMTAYADPVTLDRAKITGPMGYVIKPLEVREVQAAIEMALYKLKMDDELRAHARELERRNRHLALLNRLTAISVDDADAESLVREACRGLSDLLDLPCAFALLFDGLGEQATLIAHSDVADVLLPRTIPVGALRCDLSPERQPLILRWPAGDPRVAALRPLMVVHSVSELAVFPLVAHEEWIGCVALCALQPGRFTPGDVDLCRDVIEHLAAALTRVRLLAERQRMSAIIEQADESILVTDTQGSIVYVNPAFERLTGYTLDQVRDKNPRILQSGHTSHETFDEMWDAVLADRTWRGRLENRKKDGSLYTVDATVVPVHSKNNGIENLVSIQRDVTNELRIEEQARQSLKMEAVGRLAAGVAHDFNNLLTVITGCGSLAQGELAADHAARELLDEILSASDRAADLAAQLLAFSRKQSRQPQVLDIGQVLADLAAMLRRIVDESISLEASSVPGLWAVKVDPSQLERVIVNLAANARDAMPLGGELTLQARNVVLGREQAAFDPELAPGEYVELSVRDTGTGISPEVMPHLFEPFFTTKEVSRGTGLGLATVYGIVKQSGGAIRVDSEVDQGATFTIYLPRALEPIQVVSPAPAPVRTRNGGETILLVEDDMAVRELSHRVLSGLGYALLPACDGREAQDLAAMHDGEIDLLLTDVVMPRGSGLHLADELTARHPQLKVLFMSGYSGDALGEFGLTITKAPLLSKPFQPLDLAHKVRAVLDG